jgi:hypothetical protein
MTLELSMDMVLPRVDAWSAEHIGGTLDAPPGPPLAEGCCRVEQLNCFGKAAEL